MGLFNHSCTNCGHSVSNKAKFCSACRAPQAEAWTTCDLCGVAVGAESDYCWKCSANLKTQAGRRIYDDRWIASPNEFAIRMVIRTPKTTLRHGVEVAAGTLGLVFQDGQIQEKLMPGYHAQDSLWQRLTSSSQGDSVEVVLVNTRSAELDFAVHSLRDKSMIPVDARVRLEIEVAGVADFVDTVVKDRATLDVHDVVNQFQGDVEACLRAAVAASDIRELTGNLNARDRLAEPLKEKLGPVLERHGLRLVDVRLAQFGGQALEEIIERDGTLAKAALMADQELAMRTLDRKIELGQFTSELQLQQSMQAISHEHGLEQSKREHWTNLWKRQQAHELTLDDLAKEREVRMQEIDRRMAEDRRARGLESEQIQHQREEGIHDARHSVQLDTIHHEQKQKKLADAIETWKKVESIKHDRQAARERLELESEEERRRIQREDKIKMAQGFQGIETQAALVASGASPEHLIELARLRGSTPAAAPEPAATATAFGPLLVAQVESCVALIVVRNPEPDPNVVHIIGTAFVIGGNKLAATAHQAAEVQTYLEQNLRVEVMLPDCTAPVTAVRAHTRYSPEADNLGPHGEPPVVPMFDVAVLLTQASFAHQLTLASVPVIRDLQKGQRVFYLGYPIEEVKGGVNLHRPQAWFKDGTLSAITDFWGGASRTAGDALLLQHSCPMSGGASGSPLLNEQGQVIGIVSARNQRQTFHQDEQGQTHLGKQTSAVQINYAQRSDLLQALL